MRRIIIALIISSIAQGHAIAETIKIVAFGDSGIYGSGQAHVSKRTGGVPVSEAYPAKLERALRARGWDVSILNQGLPGMTAAEVAFNVDMHVFPGTNITILQFGANDHWSGRSPEQIVASLVEIIGKIHAKGSAVLLVRQWAANPAFSPARLSADAFATWYDGLSPNWSPKSEYDSGDGEHLNAAATDIIVARAVPDVERLLKQRGFRPTH